MSSQESRRLTYERIATTEGTGDPVIHAELPDAGSKMDFIYVEDEGLIRVWSVESGAKGDMSCILDDVTDQLGTNNVHFLEPDLGPLEDMLEGFERVEEVVEGRNGEKLESVFLRGEWRRGGGG